MRSHCHDFLRYTKSSDKINYYHSQCSPLLYTDKEVQRQMRAPFSLRHSLNYWMNMSYFQIAHTFMGHIILCTGILNHTVLCEMYFHVPSGTFIIFVILVLWCDVDQTSVAIMFYYGMFFMRFNVPVYKSTSLFIKCSVLLMVMILRGSQAWVVSWGCKGLFRLYLIYQANIHPLFNPPTKQKRKQLYILH